MATMNASLPDPMKERVDARAGRYDHAGDLIRRDQERAGRIADLRRLVTEGSGGGVSGRPRDEVARASGEMAGASRQRWT